MKWLVATALIIVGILAVISFPDHKEQEYVFKESSDNKALITLYKNELNKTYSAKTQKKLIQALIKTNDKKTFEEASKYFTLSSDKELSKELINYALFVDNKKEYLKWLNKTYELTKDPAYIKQRADYFSFIKDMPALTNELIRLYGIDGKIDTLKALYAVGARKFAIERLLEQKDLLSDEQKIELFYYLAWDNRLKEAYDFYNTELLSVKDEKLDKTAISLAYYFEDNENLLNIYEKLYDETKKQEYLENLANMYSSLFMIDKAIYAYERLFYISGKRDYLLLAYNLAYNLNKTDKADELKTKEIFTFKVEDELISYIVRLMDLNKGEKAKETLEKFIAQNPNSLEARNALAFYDILNDKTDDAKALFYSFAPDKLSERELYYFIISPNTDERDIPYITAFAQKTKDPIYLKKAVAYIISHSGMAEARRFFENAVGKNLDETNIEAYLTILPQNIAKQEISKEIKTSFNPKLLNKIGEYLMAQNDNLLAKEAFLTALKYNPEYLSALKNIGKLELWSGNMKLSAQYFEKYLTKKPDDVEVRFYLAEIYWANNLTLKAKENYKFVLDNLEPKTYEQDDMFIKSYAKIYGIMRAKEAYKALIAKSGADQSIYADYMESLYNENQLSELANEFKGFNYKTSTNKRLIQLYANYNAKLQRYGEAQSAFASAGAVNASIFGDSAYAYEQSGEQLLALEAYNKALRLDPNNDAYIKNKQRLQRALGSFAALEFNSSNGDVYKGARVEFTDSFGRLGLSYLNNTNGNLYRAYISDLEQKKYFLEVGNKYFGASYGNKIKIGYEYAPFWPNNTASNQKMQTSYPYVQNADSVNDSLSYSLKYGPINYSNVNGNVANGYLFEGSLNYIITPGLAYQLANYTNNFYNINKSSTAYSLTSVAFTNNTLSVAYPINNLTNLVASAGVSVGYGKASPIGGVGLDAFNYLYISYGLNRDLFTNQIVQNLNIALKCNF